MKSIAFLLIILVCSWQPSAGQGVTSISTPTDFSSFERRPFQVLHAEGVQLVGYLRPVVPLDLLFRRDTLVVSEAGHLILVHHSGAFLEFSQDTTLAVSELSAPFSFSAPDTLFKARPSIQHLITSKRQFDLVAAICRPNPINIQILFPRSHLVEVPEYDPQFHILWENLNQGEERVELYVVEIRNIFDQYVTEISTDKEEITFDLNPYLYDENFFIIQVRSATNAELTSQYIGVKVKKLPTSRQTEITSAIQALERAWYLESAQRIPEARRFYEMAKKLSDKPIYQQLYEWHIQRWSNEF